MRVTQGCFSFLPDLTDEQISRQVPYCLERGWAVNIEFTDDPHPRDNFWEMWGDLRDAAGVMRPRASLPTEPEHWPLPDDQHNLLSSRPISH